MIIITVIIIIIIIIVPFLFLCLYVSLFLFFFISLYLCLSRWTLPWATRVFVIIFVLVFRALINSICLLILSVSVCPSNFVCPLTYTYVFVRLFTCLPTYLFICIQSSLILSGKCTYTGKGTAVAKAALPISTSVCVQHFPVSKQWHVWKCWGFLTCVHNFMLMLSIVHWGYTGTARESAQNADFG